jgi:hypothetical protein
MNKSNIRYEGDIEKSDLAKRLIEELPSGTFREGILITVEIPEVKTATSADLIVKSRGSEPIDEVDIPEGSEDVFYDGSNETLRRLLFRYNETSYIVFVR